MRHSIDAPCMHATHRSARGRCPRPCSPGRSTWARQSRCPRSGRCSRCRRCLEWEGSAGSGGEGRAARVGRRGSGDGAWWGSCTSKRRLRWTGPTFCCQQAPCCANHTPQLASSLKDTHSWPHESGRSSEHAHCPLTQMLLSEHARPQAPAIGRQRDHRRLPMRTACSPHPSAGQTAGQLRSPLTAVLPIVGNIGAQGPKLGVLAAAGPLALTRVAAPSAVAGTECDALARRLAPSLPGSAAAAGGALLASLAGVAAGAWSDSGRDGPCSRHPACALHHMLQQHATVPLLTTGLRVRIKVDAAALAAARSVARRARLPAGACSRRWGRRCMAGAMM